ncbi:restriction endonuclease subunit S [Vibrio owensii]|uniref:restriction endonuclease subunit S n=1 Tax=Vibrio owensii TaxID=696485 RepID=UPI000995ECB5|nr:restriction endonuclease subunit S [Vibrio owensii]AQW57134.1 hypothetical protein A9237_02930 [Vibrio owensii]
MNIPKYSDKKSSGVSWLPKIPQHWDMIKISHMALLKSGKNITSENIDTKGEYLVYGGNGIRGYYHDFTHDGDFVLIGRQGALCGNINYASSKFWASEHAIVVNPDREVNIFWLGETLRVMNLGRLSTAAAQPGISVDVVKQQKLPYPPLEEQNKISLFIRAKTRFIDQLIGSKKNIINSLIESRRSLINKVVMEGIASETIRKETDLDWLGAIPEHWKVKRFRHLFEFGRGLGITKKDLKDEGIPCVNYGEIHSKFGFEVDPDKHVLKCVEESYIESGYDSLLKNGDFVFADTSEDLDGAGNFTYLNSEEPTFAGYHTVIARLQTDDLPRYLAYLFESEMFRYQVRKSVSGVKVYSVTQAILKSCFLWLPPKDEQASAVTFLDNKIKKIESMISVNERAIDKLLEYRNNLILSVVTGQVDVRNIDIPAE